MKIHIGPQEEAIIAQQLKTGRYEDAAQVVSEALGILNATPRSVDELQRMLDAGLDELDQGEGKNWNAKTFLDELHRRQSKAG